MPVIRDVEEREELYTFMHKKIFLYLKNPQSVFAKKHLILAHWGRIIDIRIK